MGRLLLCEGQWLTEYHVIHVGLIEPEIGDEIVNALRRILESPLGAHGAYFLYAAFSLSAAAVAVAFLPETRGMSLKEIEEHFAPPPSGDE